MQYDKFDVGLQAETYQVSPFTYYDSYETYETYVKLHVSYNDLARRPMKLSHDFDAKCMFHVMLKP